MSTQFLFTEQFFHPVEHAIVCDWLGRPRPPCARAVNLAEYREPLDEDGGPTRGPDTDHVCLRPSEMGFVDVGYSELDNAVARICLGDIQGRLPQWAVSRAGDGVQCSRTYDAPIGRPAPLSPIPLLELNWATQGPGFTWPEAYHVTRLPYYDLNVVTASADSPEAQGYCDGAIGWFGCDCDLVDGAKKALAGCWSQRRADGQCRWEALWQDGLIPADEAIRIADSVWGAVEAEAL